MVELITQKSKADTNRMQRNNKHELDKAKQRVNKLDTIIQKLYEDNVEGKITDERFAKMLASYEDEQATLNSRISELEGIMTQDKEDSLNVEHFLRIVRKYTDIKELSTELIREFIEKIYVYQVEKADGHKTQRIRIVWNCIGGVGTPQTK